MERKRKMKHLIFGLVASIALAFLLAQEPVPLYGPGEPTDHARDDTTASHCSPVSKTKPCATKEPCKVCINKGQRGSEYVGERQPDDESGRYYCRERCHKDHCACPDPCAQMTRNGTPKACHSVEVE